MIGPIGICLHSYKGVEFSNYFNHLWCVAHWAQKYELVFLGKPGLDAASARNSLMERAIQAKCTHVLFMDEDHLFPAETLDCLYEVATEDHAAAVSGVVCKKGEEFQQVNWEVHADAKGLQGYYAVTLPLDGKVYQTHVCAFGATLVSVEAIKKLAKPWFRDTCEPGCDGNQNNVRSDVNLCLAFKDAGLPVFVDTRVLIGHCGESGVIYPQGAKNFKRMIELSRDLNKLSEGQVGYYYTVPGGA